MPQHEVYPVRRGSFPLEDEDVDGLHVGEDLLIVGHGVYIHGGLDHASVTSNASHVLSGVAPSLHLFDEVEAALLVREDVLHLLKAGQIIHGSFGLDHVHL